MPAASVIIRAKDEAADIGETIDRVRGQTLRDVEVIVVDSGSSDDTVAIARGRGVRIIEIPAAAFTFGGSLNTGAEVASAPVCVALSAHAFPPDEGWLERIVGACSEDGVACASGDHYGPDGGPLKGRIRQDRALAERIPWWGYSNAAGAFRTELWRQRPFREDMPGTEDKEWAWWWLRRGWLHVCGEDLVVEHDHSKDPVGEIYVRGRREWLGFRQYLDIDPQTPGELARAWWTERGTYTSIWKARLSHRRNARLLGRYAGRSPRALEAQPTGPLAPLRVAVLVDRFGVLSETFVATEIEELRVLGHQVTVEAITRGDAPLPDVRTAFVAEEGVGEKLRALAWLVATRPLACLRDLAARRRWAGEEDVAGLRALAVRARRLRRRSVEHLHVHFATRSALEALRLARLLGTSWSVTAHAFDIFLSPENLREKLESAAFATTGCEYNAAHLRGVAPGAGLHVIVMGVDVERFRRTTPLPGGRTVIAVGRLVEKKGFDVLVSACAKVAVDRLVIVGDGPERERLEELAAQLGVPAEFRGAAPPDEVRAALEAADVLAMPAVVARDGDRDSMPVVVKEAMSMELLVAASDEVGLPEAVMAPWGRLAAPGDAAALAVALGELLALSPSERAAAGAAGRAWVAEHASAAVEAARLAELIAQAASRSA